jgi:hypothetical protein
VDPKREGVEAWKQNPWTRLPRWGKWTVGIVSALVVFGLATGEDEGESDGSKVTPTTVEAQPSAESGDRASVKTPARSTTPSVPRPPASTRIRFLLADEFGDQFVSARVSHAASGGQIVVAAYNEDDDLSIDLTELAIEEEMIDAYMALFTSPDLNVREAEIDARVKLVDRFGNESYGPGWDTRMTAAVGKRIQWDRRDSLDFEGLWETTFKRPEMD